MKKKRPTKEEVLKQNWIAFNKSQSNSKLKMNFDEYCKWVNGKTRTRIKAIEKAPTYAYPVWANDTKSIPSLKSKAFNTSKTSIMESVVQGKITGEDAKNIVNKSKRIGLLTSKGAYGYISEGTDIKTLGKKSQQLE